MKSFLKVMAAFAVGATIGHLITKHTLLDCEDYDDELFFYDEDDFDEFEDFDDFDDDDDEIDAVEHDDLEPDSQFYDEA